MKKTLLALAITGLICSTTGCASGPLNQWFRGAPCNTCNPPIGASGNLNLAPPCDSGCGSSRNGFFGGFFDWLRPQSTQAPASLPGGVFPGDPGVQYYGDPGIPALEINPGTIGPLGSVGSVGPLGSVGSVGPIGSIGSAGAVGQGVIPQGGIVDQGLVAPGSFLPSQAEIQPQIAPLTPTSDELYGSGIRSGIPPSVGPEISGF